MRGKGGTVGGLVSDILTQYEAFLGYVQKPEGELLSELADRDKRTGALDEARSFGTRIFKLLLEATDEDRLRHLLV